MARKKEEKREVTCFRLLESDVRSIQIIVKASGNDASTIMRGLMRLGLAVYLKESQTNKSEALLRIVRAGSFN